MGVCVMLCFTAMATPSLFVCVMFFWCTLYVYSFMFCVSVFPCEFKSIMSGLYCVYILLSSSLLLFHFSTLCCNTVRLKLK